MTTPIQFGPASLAKLPLPKALEATEAKGPGFQDLLLNGLDQVQQMQSQADQAVEKMLVGDEVNTADVLTAVQKADLAFQLMMQIRNKMVDAFQEIKELRI